MSKRTYSVDFERGIFDWMVSMGLVREWETLDINTHAYGSPIHDKLDQNTQSRRMWIQ